MLWRSVPRASLRPRSRTTPLPRRRIFVGAMCCWRLTTSRCRALRTSSTALHGSQAGSHGALHRAASGHPRSRRSADCAHSERRTALLFPACRRRYLHVARRRCRACCVLATRPLFISCGCQSRSFGLFTFSFSGRLDRLDWVFYWGDAISILMLPALFLHFALVFPERSAQVGVGSDRSQPRPADLRARRRVGRCARRSCWLAAPRMLRLFVGMVGTLDRLEHALSRGVFRRGARGSYTDVRRRVAPSRRGGSCDGSPGARASVSLRLCSAMPFPGRWV